MKQNRNAHEFNVYDQNGELLCPICGIEGQFAKPAYDGQGGVIGSGICGACLWEPGFDDDPKASASALPTIKASMLRYRQEWLDSG